MFNDRKLEIDNKYKKLYQIKNSNEEIRLLNIEKNLEICLNNQSFLVNNFLNNIKLFKIKNLSTTIKKIIDIFDINPFFDNFDFHLLNSDYLMNFFIIFLNNFYSTFLIQNLGEYKNNFNIIYCFFFKLRTSLNFIYKTYFNDNYKIINYNRIKFLNKNKIHLNQNIEKIEKKLVNLLKNHEIDFDNLKNNNFNLLLEYYKNDDTIQLSEKTNKKKILFSSLKFLKK